MFFFQVFSLNDTIARQSKYKMAEIIDGKKIAEKIHNETKKALEQSTVTPRIGIFLATEDESSHKYVELKSAAAEKLGIETKVYQFENDVTPEELIHEIKRTKNNEALHGVLVQLPLFKSLESQRTEILNSIEPSKDIDGLTAYQSGRVSHLIENSIPPATVEAVLECLAVCIDPTLRWGNITSNGGKSGVLNGKVITIINNTNLIGKPLAIILSTLGGTIKIANEHTKDLANLTVDSDIVISATGQTDLIGHDMIKEESILIDVTSVMKDEKIKGDFIRTSELENKASYITPVPGGIGPITVACLLRNIVRLQMGSDFLG
jgi:methylenetetrahydrofolate dehydrogenase (NADP+)/methenyltetrahydrofolate cyclohydrolase